MKSPVIALALLLIFGLAGCDQLQPTTKPAEAPPQQQPRREHHFDQIARSEGNLAVDTATGQMCKTWEWVCGTDGDTFYNPNTKKVQERTSYGITCAAIRTMPTCESISRQ